MLGGSLLVGAVGCTDKFEDFNTDPYAPTPEQMEGDFASTAALISTMLPNLALGQENDFQMIDQMIGCEYGRMTSAANAWGSDMYYATYNPPVGWTGNAFDTMMPKVYTPFFMIRRISGTESLTYYWADFVRIFTTLRLSDIYGPMPFSKIGTGTDFAVAYDDMPTLYNAMFENLDVIINALKEASGGNGGALFADVDYIYQGNFTKWAKYANTVKLRMALRLVNVEPNLAKQKAEEAVADPAGLVSETGDAAWSNFIPGGNSFHKTNILWNEGRVSADITSYMNGYADPRLPKYAQEAPGAPGEYIGARSGVYHYSILKNNTDNYSYPNVGAQDKLLSMAASESWFLRAEGALRGWNMGGTAQELYEQGVRTSMSERGVEIGSYLESEAIPAAYSVVSGDNASYNIAAQTDVTPKWDASATFEKNLERIIVQKWLGNYPNGWESWVDKRRTGYPIWFPVVDNRSTAGVTAAQGMQRLPYPQSEFNTNEANVKAAQGMLGGPDNGATKLWWAKK